MHLALVLVAALAADQLELPAGPEAESANLTFGPEVVSQAAEPTRHRLTAADMAAQFHLYSVEVLSPVVWLQEPSAAKNAKPTISEWKGFFRVRCNGQMPVDGVFQVDGRPVQPAIEWSFRGNTRVRNTPVVVGENQNGDFDLRIREPGRYTFIATVGKAWSAQVTIEAKPFPFELGMRKPAFLEKYGNPDATMPNGYLIYRRWTGLGIHEREGFGMQAETVPPQTWQVSLPTANPGVQATDVPEATAEQFVVFFNRVSGFNINVAGDRRTAGADVIQWDEPQVNTNSQWRIEPVDGPYCRLHNKSTGLYLSIAESSNPRESQKVTQAVRGDSHSQHWKVQRLRNGFVAIVNRSSNLCLAPWNGSKVRGDGIHQYPFKSDRPELQWRLEFTCDPRATVNPGIVITRAVWGNQHGMADVTARVASAINEGRTLLVDNNDMGCDPDPGRPKVLVVKYRSKGSTREITYSAGKRFRLDNTLMELTTE